MHRQVRFGSVTETQAQQPAQPEPQLSPWAPVTFFETILVSVIASVVTEYTMTLFFGRRSRK